MMVKKSDDLAQKVHGMMVIPQASGPACKNRSGIIDYGENREATNHKIQTSPLSKTDS